MLLELLKSLDGADVALFRKFEEELKYLLHDPVTGELIECSEGMPEDAALSDKTRSLFEQVIQKLMAVPSKLQSVGFQSPKAQKIGAIEDAPAKTMRRSGDVPGAAGLTHTIKRQSSSIPSSVEVTARSSGLPLAAKG